MLIGTKELKEQGYSDWLIRKLINSDGSPFFRQGRKWRVHDDALQKFEKEGRKYERENN